MLTEMIDYGVMIVGKNTKSYIITKNRKKSKKPYNVCQMTLSIAGSRI